MPRYAIKIAYDGTDYAGFQRQPNKITVQEKVEEVLSKKLNQNIEIMYCGRTDAGVHSTCQVAHFDCNKEINTSNLGYSVNTMLPQDIAIVNCQKVDDNFHARYDAKRKTYCYSVICSQIHKPMQYRYAHICFYKLNIEDIEKACKLFVGQHDFRSFMSTKTIKENTIRTIYDCHIEVSNNGKTLIL